MDKALTVSEYCELLNSALGNLRAKVIGEIAGFNGPHTSGHAYFSLKDEEDESILNCAMWNRNYTLSGIKPENGMKVIATGYPNLYKKTGRLSFIIDTLELVGEGALKKHYDELKAKLMKEGLFDEERKRPVPQFVHNIGIISSAHGAVIHDFQNNLGRHGFNLKFVNSLVEGQEAVKDILASIKTMSKEDIDVLVIMRGGGSLQSLAAFDNEALVREIIKFPVPVIAGIGHHQDVPLLALASDIAVSTPTAVANAINQPWIEAGRQLDNLEHSIISSFKNVIYVKREVIEDIKRKVSRAFEDINFKFKKLESIVPVNMQRLEDTILNKRKKLFELKLLILSKNRDALKYATQKVENLEKQINLNNPHRILSLGYSIALKNNRVIKSIKSVIIGDTLEMLVTDGQIISEVKKTNGKK